jgi:hypothetical protein
LRLDVTARILVTSQRLTRTESSSRDVTGLLVDWTRGDRRALDRLLPLVYDELRRIAARQL